MVRINVFLTLIYLHTQVTLNCGKKNVLFIVVDDMRPQIGAYFTDTYPPYASTKMHTPHIDELASRSLLLQRAYVQQALCGPSRASLLTGRRPDTTHVYTCDHNFRTTGGNFTTIPQYFKNRGYKSVGHGKIFHSTPGSQGKLSGKVDDPVSWSEPYFRGVPTFEDTRNSWEAVPDKLLIEKPLIDEQVANHAINTLKRLAPAARSGRQPFFVAVGFRKPHLPFVFPESCLRYYPYVKLPDNPYAPVNMPKIAWSTWNRLRNYNDTKPYNASGHINDTTFPDETIISLRRAYYCCVTWVDSLIGRVLAQLDYLGLTNNTIVSLIGDHGFHLGENGLWLKQTNFELAVHAPMMIHIPGRTDKGIKTDQLIEFIDLFPTLVDAAGLQPLSVCPYNSREIQECGEGLSFLPLINNPNTPLREAAFSQYMRGKVMGYSMKTDRYRYTEWPSFKNEPGFVPNWTDTAGVELYDHRIDPEENVNLALDQTYKMIKHRLSAMLRNRWRKGLIVTHNTSIPEYNLSRQVVEQSSHMPVRSPHAIIIVTVLLTTVVCACMHRSKRFTRAVWTTLFKHISINTAQ